jgi:transposase
MEQRAANKFCVKLKKTATETFASGEECSSRTSASEWHKRFKEGRESLQDDERKGRPLLPEQKKRRKSFTTVWPKIEL